MLANGGGSRVDGGCDLAFDILAYAKVGASAAH